MTEQEFDRRVERAADRLEQRIEGAADRLDRSLTRKWEHRPFRVLVKSLSFAAELGLMAGGLLLSREDHKLWAGICFWTGAAGLLCDLLRCLFLRRKP